MLLLSILVYLSLQYLLQLKDGKQYQYQISKYLYMGPSIYHVVRFSEILTPPPPSWSNMVIWPTPSRNYVVNPGTPPPSHTIHKIFINICTIFITCWYNYIVIQKFVMLQLKFRIHSIIF